MSFPSLESLIDTWTTDMLLTEVQENKQNIQIKLNQHHCCYAVDYYFTSPSICYKNTKLCLK